MKYDDRFKWGTQLSSHILQYENSIALNEKEIDVIKEKISIMEGAADSLVNVNNDAFESLYKEMQTMRSRIGYLNEENYRMSTSIVGWQAVIGALDIDS